MKGILSPWRRRQMIRQIEREKWRRHLEDERRQSQQSDISPMIAPILSNGDAGYSSDGGGSDSGSSGGDSGGGGW